MGGTMTIFRQEKTETVMKGKWCIRIAPNQEKIKIYLTYWYGNKKWFALRKQPYAGHFRKTYMFVPYTWQKTRSNSNFDICSHCATWKTVEKLETLVYNANAIGRQYLIITIHVHVLTYFKNGWNMWTTLQH